MDLNWCIICDKHIDTEDCLYCSLECKAMDSVNLSLNIPSYELPGAHKTRRHSTVTSGIPVVPTRHDHGSAASSFSSTHSHLAITPPNIPLLGTQCAENTKLPQQPPVICSAM
ncbi:hypothetical protein K493DRAFT_407299 [Basidiobolus meristosporus CBS 931.73]|uniref:Uncharacterized protein n=1 Tax=Basidiobolus meristosporus CBS 931.73 TaxID=1314790 RepID=A0A1Y1YE29_9FUNG|nr:hypothetical protein K493DRAFT_407299 [Basidiobolus meristosporus CBS 931.73]|eukprot:ORX96262.1 hypothetical protein K493DRAFT_407299 [Basidiobolus meristosporus CBS 931.73]